MKFQYSRTSVKYLHTLEKKMASKILNAVEDLPRKGDIRPLKGREIRNIFRLRIGKYRIIYSVEKDLIKVIRIDTRGDVY